MSTYYKFIDSYKGLTCTLTHRACSEDCTKCVFALVAFAREMNKKEEVDE